MKLRILLIAIATLLAAPFALAQNQQGQAWALARLEGKSPRHQEWVKIPTATRPLQNFVVYPEVATKATVVIVIHENMGLSDWARAFADEIAEALGLELANRLRHAGVEVLEARLSHLAYSPEIAGAIALCGSEVLPQLM